MGNARNLASLLSTDDKVKSDDIADGSINADKLAGSITGAKFADSAVDVTSKVTGTLGTSNGGLGLTSLGSGGQALLVNSGGTAFEFSAVTSDLTEQQRDIALLALNDTIQQSRASHELTSNLNDAYTNTDNVTSLSGVTVSGGKSNTSSSLSGTTVYINPWITSGTFTSIDSASTPSFTISSPGTGAWESGGSNFTYVDHTSSAPGGGGYYIVPQGTTYNWATTKVTWTAQVVTKAGGGGGGWNMQITKAAPTIWTAYNSGRNHTGGYDPNMGFSSGTASVGWQIRFTYSPLEDQNSITQEKRNSNSGTWTNVDQATGDGFNAGWSTLDVATSGLVYAGYSFKDANPNWTIRNWFAVETGAQNASGSYQSTATTISSAVTQMGVVALVKNAAGSATLNTDIKISVSANNGTNFTQVTLTSTGQVLSTGLNTIISDKVTVTSGTQLKYKVEFANQSASKSTELHGISLIY